MKKSFKRVIATIMSVTTIAASVVGMNAQAATKYWTTQTIYDSSFVAVGEAYNGVSSTSVYLSTTRYSPYYSFDVALDYINGNVTSYSGGFDGTNRKYIQYIGTNIKSAKSIHTVNGYVKEITMYA